MAQRSIEGKSYPCALAYRSKYISMVSVQPKMTLAGYEVCRFDGSEFQNRGQAKAMVHKFFLDLFSKNGIDLGNRILYIRKAHL